MEAFSSKEIDMCASFNELQTSDYKLENKTRLFEKLTKMIYNKIE